MNTPVPTMRPLQAITLCLLLGATACTTTSNVVETEAERQHHNALTDDYVVFENASELADRIVLEQVTRNLQAVPLVVQFNIRNDSDERYDFLYRVRWLDQFGIEIHHSTEGWVRESILGGERLNLPGAAPSPAAVDYRLVLRPAR